MAPGQHRDRTDEECSISAGQPRPGDDIPGCGQDQGKDRYGHELRPIAEAVRLAFEGRNIETCVSRLPPGLAAGQKPVKIKAEALLGGPDGLGLIRRLVGALPSDVSFVALEVGAGQADDVAALLTGAGFGSLARLRDLAGHERVVVARR